MALGMTPAISPRRSEQKCCFAHRQEAGAKEKNRFTPFKVNVKRKGKTKEQKHPPFVLSGRRWDAETLHFNWAYSIWIFDLHFVEGKQTPRAGKHQEPQRISFYRSISGHPRSREGDATGKLDGGQRFLGRNPAAGGLCSSSPQGTAPRCLSL